jgi:hypothetical protein
VTAVNSNLDQHVNRATDLSFLDHFTVTLTSDIFKETCQQPRLDLWMHDNMMFELTCLHLLDGLQLDFGNIIFVHVKQNVLYHNDAEFLISP